MLKTRPALYEVVGSQNNHLWLEVLEGDDAGIRVSIPVRHSTYEDNDLQSQVLRLSEGDVAQLVLESETEQRPDWRISEICELKDSEDAVPA